MKRFVEGVSREQSTLFPETLEDFIDKDNPVRVVDDFVEGLDFRWRSGAITSDYFLYVKTQKSELSF